MNEKIQKLAKNVALLSVASNSVLVISKIVIGLLIGSVSVISEAIHSCIDLIAAVIAFFAVREASKSPDEEHQYGHGKFENVSGTIEALLIFIAAGWIIYEAIHKFKNPTPIENSGLGIIIMLVSGIINLIVSEVLFKVGKKADSIALKADAWHLRTDVYTSLGVMLGLAIIWFASRFYPDKNLNWIDPVAAIFVALLIIKAAYDLTIQAARDLFDVSLPKEEIIWIKNYLTSEAKNIENQITGFHNLKTRKAGKVRFVEFHLVVNEKLSVKESHNITEKITKEIENKFQNVHVLIHIEPCDKECKTHCKSQCFVESNK